MTTLDVMKIFAAPFFAFCIAIFSLLINPPAPNKRKVLWSLVVLLLIATSVSAYINYGDMVESKVRNEELQKQVEGLSEDNNDLRDRINTNIDQVELVVQRILKQGYSQPITRGASRGQIKDMFDADKEWQKIIVDRLKRNDFPQNTEVQYFQKDFDDPVFLAILKEAGLLGFEVKFEPSVRPDLRTNFLLATDSVSVKDVQLAALTLLRNGIRLRFVGRECKELQHPRTLIQIGAETRLNLTSLKFIETHDILNMTELSYPHYCRRGP